MPHVRRFFVRYCNQLQALQFWLFVVTSVLAGMAFAVWVLQAKMDMQIAEVRLDALKQVQTVINQADRRVGELQTVNKQLLDKLPAVLGAAGEAAETAKDAAQSANRAASAAGRAGDSAKAASSQAAKAAQAAKGVAVDIDRAMNPPLTPPKDAPEWLGGR